MALTLAFFSASPWQLLLVLFVALLLFGHRLPGMMRSLGEGIVEFKKGVKGIEEDPSVKERTDQASRESQPETKPEDGPTSGDA